MSHEGAILVETMKFFARPARHRRSSTVALVGAVALMSGTWALSACSAPGQKDSSTGIVETAQSFSPAPAEPQASESATASSQATAMGSATAAAPVAIPADLRAQAASLIMVGVADFDDALWALRQGAGGIFLSSTTNPELLSTPGRDIAALRAQVGRDFDVSIDFEGGRVQRFAELLGNYPSPQQMAATMSPEQVRGLAFDLGTTLAGHGITVNFAPVVDVDGAGLDVVGDRSFSDDPAVVATYAAAFSQGMLDAGVRPVYKHFPGHGRASGDSHTGQVLTPPLADLQTYDLVPYHSLLGPTGPQGAGVMVGHMSVPGLGEATASSLNPAAYDLLRSFNFGGLIYTDDLSGMRAISDSYTPAQAAVASLSAGADQALWISTAGLVEAVDAVVAAVQSGSYPRAQFDASVARVAAS